MTKFVFRWMLLLSLITIPLQAEDRMTLPPKTGPS